MIQTQKEEGHACALTVFKFQSSQHSLWQMIFSCIVWSHFPSLITKVATADKKGNFLTIWGLVAYCSDQWSWVADTTELEELGTPMISSFHLILCLLPLFKPGQLLSETKWHPLALITGTRLRHGLSAWGHYLKGSTRFWKRNHEDVLPSGFGAV